MIPILIIGCIFALALFGSKFLSKELTQSTGINVDMFRIFSLLIAILRLANESQDLIFGYKSNFRQLHNHASVETTDVQDYAEHGDHDESPSD